MICVETRELYMLRYTRCTTFAACASCAVYYVYASDCMHVFDRTSACIAWRASWSGVRLPLAVPEALVPQSKSAQSLDDGARRCSLPSNTKFVCVQRYGARPCTACSRVRSNPFTAGPATSSSDTCFALTRSSWCTHDAWQGLPNARIAPTVCRGRHARACSHLCS